MPDDDSTSMIGQMQDLVIGAAVLLLGYMAFRLANSKIFKATGDVLNGAANAVQWSLSSPWAFLLTVILGAAGWVAVTLGVPKVRGFSKGGTTPEKPTTEKNPTEAPEEDRPIEPRDWKPTTKAAEAAAKAIAEHESDLNILRIKAEDVMELYYDYTRIVQAKGHMKEGDYKLSNAEMESVSGQEFRSPIMEKLGSKIESKFRNRFGLLCEKLDKINVTSIAAAIRDPTTITAPDVFAYLLEEIHGGNEDRAADAFTRLLWNAKNGLLKGKTWDSIKVKSWIGSGNVESAVNTAKREYVEEKNRKIVEQKLEDARKAADKAKATGRSGETPGGERSRVERRTSGKPEPIVPKEMVE